MPKQKYPPHKKTTSLWKKHLFLSSAVVLIAAGALAAFELTNTTFFFHDKPVQTTGSPATKVKKPASNSPQPHQSSSTTADGSTKIVTSSGQGDNSSTNNATQSDVSLEKPRGPFVSNHSPNLDGKPAPNTINSVCSTTSGATCQIIFTKGDTTMKLPAQITDAGGATYWNSWNLHDIGLTQGEWKITAKATLGTQTKTTVAALPLKVSP